MFSRQRAGKQFITLEAGDELLRPVPLFDGATQLALLSDKGKFLVFGLDEVKSLSGGGRGTILMGLDTADKLDQAVPIGAAGAAPLVCTATSTPRTSWPARRSRPMWASARARAGSWTCARSSRCCRRCWAERPGAFREHANPAPCWRGIFLGGVLAVSIRGACGLAWTGSARSFR